jgi:hypothetical protein
MKDWPEKLRLLAVLSMTTSLLDRSEEDGLATYTPDQIRKDINQIIDSMFFGKSQKLPEHWETIYAPTCSLQDISIANGWGEIFLKLAAEFDTLAYLLKEHEAEPCH